jgi:hypothetical protein
MYDVTSSSSEFYVFRWGMTIKAQSLDAAYDIYPMRLTVITLTKIDCTLPSFYSLQTLSLHNEYLVPYRTLRRRPMVEHEDVKLLFFKVLLSVRGDNLCMNSTDYSR